MRELTENRKIPAAFCVCGENDVFKYMKTDIFFYIIQGTCTHCIINISRTATKMTKTTKYKGGKQGCC